MKYYNQLKQIIEKSYHLQYLQRILSWEEMVSMPDGAGKNRSNALATFKQLSHTVFSSKKTKSLLLRAKQEDLKSDWDKANFYWLEKIHSSLSVIPSKIQAKSTQAISLALQAWRKNRQINNWNDFRPYLKKSYQFMKEIAIRKSEVLGLSPYDVLIDGFSSGLNQNIIDKIFEKLKPEVLALRKQIILRQQSDVFQTIQGVFPIKNQKQLARKIMIAMNFDFNRGRLDSSHHPYCDGIVTDTRITTCYNERNIFDSLFAVIHETGHALYEQGVPQAWIFQPVGQPQCKLTHESQALLFENEVAHDKPFYYGLEKILCDLFGKSKQFDAENLYLNNLQIKKTLIRIDADEVSYALHVMMRYDIERALFNNEITVDDLPAIWNDKMLEYFNISTKGNFKDGVMQDIHWAFGYFGYFPIYVCGQLMASQLYATFNKQNNNFYNEIQDLNFAVLHAWLQNNIYAYGSSLSYDQLLTKISGETLNPSYFINRIKARYLGNSTRELT